MACGGFAGVIARAVGKNRRAAGPYHRSDMRNLRVTASVRRVAATAARGAGLGGAPAAARALASLVSLLILLLCTPPLAIAQTQATVVGSGGATSNGGIDLKVLQFGVGGLARPGAWTGVQVQLTELAARSREVVLQIGVRDPDGDTAQYQSVVATNPGSKVITWVYMRLPFRVDGQSSFVLTASEKGSAGTAQTAVGVAPAGPLIARVVFQPGADRVTDASVGLLGVVGRSSPALELLGSRASSVVPWPAMTHERLGIASGIGTSSMPDLWLGLAGMSALVWTASGPDGEPSDLSELQAGAVREWVRRGGHLVVVLPGVGSSWLSTSQPLADIAPRVKVVRIEGYELSAIRPLLSYRDVALATGTLQTFVPLPGASESEATSLMQNPEGQSFVTRRAIGSGAVTFVGVNVADRTLNSIGGVQADAFWARVLGRRGRLPQPEEVLAMESANASPKRYFGGREQVWLDAQVAGSINRTARAALGVLLAFVVFAGYWVLAGPAGVWLLARLKRPQWSWVGFVGVGVVFTGLAWGGARVLRPSGASVTHLTVLDHVFGQPTQRARVLASVGLPGYGDVRVGVAGAEAATGVFNAVSAWDAPPSTDVTPSMFPDARDYPVNGRDPDELLVPARATVKTICVDWLGGPVLKLPMPVTAESTGTSRTPTQVRVVPRAPGASARAWELSGALVHDLPGPMEGVMMVLVQAPTLAVGAQRASDEQLFAVAFGREVATWAPGEVLALDGDAAGWRPAEQLLSGLVPLSRSDAFTGATVMQTRQSIETQMRAMSLLSVLPPPDTTQPGGQVQAVRAEFQGSDLSRWFGQPCLIVMGWVNNVPGPVTLAVNGEGVESNGRVFVRWVLPLPGPAARVQVRAAN